MNGGHRERWFWCATVLAAAAAALHAWFLRWTCDDAYISFRYAQHLVEGHGLRFNLDPQEPPVEGYTNFAWTLWLALGMALGWARDAIEAWSWAWGSLLHGATALVLAVMARRFARAPGRGGSDRVVVPIAAIGWAVHHHAASLAPAGLETALFVLLGVAMAALCCAPRSPRGDVALGLLGVLAATTRPDGALFCAAAGAFVVHDAWRARRAAGVLAFAAPFLLLFLPYLLWRHAYYGQWVPNTFFAKSGSDPYLSQGLRYLGDYALCYWALIPAALLCVALPFVRRDGTTRDDARARAAFVLPAFALPYLAFVAWVGGDFMFARFVLPVTPMLLLALDLCLQRWPRAAAATAAALALGLAARARPAWLDDYRNGRGYSDNRAISMPLLDYARDAGDRLGELIAGLDVRIGIAGSHANLAYRSRAPVAIECAAGLTDAYIAHLPLTGRGITGHERPWTLYPQYLEQRGVQVMFELSYETPRIPKAWQDLKLPGVPLRLPARLVFWDGKLMTELKRRDPDLGCVDVERELDAYIAALPGKDKKDVAADLVGLRRFYFDHNDDPARLHAITSFLAK
jgi:hypothetical protein